jgi:hypothetical protein
MEQRIARLEDWRMTADKCLVTIEQDVRAAREGVQRLEIEFAKIRTCPSPGLCLELHAKTKEMALTLEELKAETNQAKGAIWASRVLIGLVCAIIGSVITHFISK